jgi:DNA-binding CsgD family transcriptional regulator
VERLEGRRAVDAVLEADAWRAPGLQWDVEDLLSLLASMSAHEVEGVADLIARLVPAESVREIEVIRVDARGGVHRPRDPLPGSDLLAWAVECVWGATGVLDWIAQGRTLVRFAAGGDPTLAFFCVPVPDPLGSHSLVACSVATDSRDEAMRTAARLTALSMPRFLSQDRSESAIPAAMPIPATLSARQMTILHGMAEGLTNRQIAQRICFSESTVRLESMAIYRYLGVHSRGHAVAAARAEGFLLDERLSVGA